MARKIDPDHGGVDDAGLIGPLHGAPALKGGARREFAKQIVDDLVGGMIDEAMDNLANPKASPASDTPSNMTVLPPAETASASATTLQSADNPQAQTP